MSELMTALTGMGNDTRDAEEVDMTGLDKANSKTKKVFSFLEFITIVMPLIEIRNIIGRGASVT